MTYPKWVQRAPHIGPVLCVSADEEKQLMDEWNGARLEEAEAGARKAAQDAAAARAFAEEAVEVATPNLSKAKR